LVTACMSLADDTLRLPVVNAFARPENVGSRRVLEKAGFAVVRHVAEMQRLLYCRYKYGRGS
jgi:[ribosomal protein S5]-alanine N-acetyltransferase